MPKQEVRYARIEALANMASDLLKQGAAQEQTLESLVEAAVYNWMLSERVARDYARTALVIARGRLEKAAGSGSGGEGGQASVGK
ncbi:MAG: hypothetical protein QW688_08305 [Thermoprotei archaeon]